MSENTRETRGAEVLPAFLRAALRDQYGEDCALRIEEGLCSSRRSSLRANTLRATVSEVTEALDAVTIPYERVGWSQEALVLPRECERTLRELDIYAQGKVYLQSLSSMLPPIVLDPHPGADICDMCAAPGGKTTQMAALSSGKARITACEMNAPRAERLAHNLEMQGARNVNLMRCDARRLDDFFSFDQILLDAPCSGSGIADVNDPKLPARLTPKLVEKCNASQRALIDKALRLLKPGGTLVYSTCSILRRENEDVVSGALSRAHAKLVPIDAGAFEGLPLLPCSLPGALCVAPTELYEGFFVARIQRVT